MSHRGGPETEKAAADKAAWSSSAMRKTVHDWIEEAGSAGLTSKEAAARFGLPLHHVAPRFTELKDFGLIRQDVSLARREACAPWITTTADKEQDDGSSTDS